jgi:aminopeptidase N
MRLHTAVSLAVLALATLAPAAASAAPLPALAQRAIPTQLPRTIRPLEYRLDIVPDAANLRFSGTAAIDIEVLQRTDAIVLNAADLAFTRVVLSGIAGQERQARTIAVNAEAQTATIAFGEPLLPGRYRLTLDYHGKIYTQAAGFFALDYDSPKGRKRALFTQFEAPDARRFFPSWDEPRFRTPYTLSVTVAAGDDAIGNMPAAATVRKAGGLKTVTFRRTPAMSSYLVFLGIGDFDRITTRAANTEIGVVTRRGNGEQGRWALTSAARILPWYNSYFGTPFPLPKLDNIAGPGSSQFFGAMENWGAIFSFENRLLLDPAISTEASRQDIFETAAHEMAHQWFGDLVTMAWWDDLWLNEGFASWMATKSTQALHPEWQRELGRVGNREGAIAQDSIATTHPIVQHLTTVDQISQAFDSITYNKGEAVIAMLEDYVGADAWRRGVQDYIRIHKYSNTQSDDLWAAVERAAPGKPVTAIAHDFTLQPGVPLVRVLAARCQAGRTVATLRQDEFTRDRPTKATLRWRVPVIAATLGGAQARTLVSGGAGTVTAPGCGALVVNSGQTGYYRTLYAAPLLARLKAEYPRLPAVDQLGLLADTWGLGLAGHQSAAEALDMIDAAPADANPRLTGSVANILAQIYGFYEGDARHQALITRYASAKLVPVLARIGWRPKPSEPATVTLLRANLVASLAAVHEPGVVAEANRLTAARDPLAVGGPLRTAIAGIVAQNADAATWDRLHEAARAEKNPLIRTQLYRQLASARDEALARRALDLALTPEPGATNSAVIMSAVAGQHPDLAFDFAIRHREAVEALVDISSRSRFVPQLGARSTDPAMIGRIEDYATRYLTLQSRRPADEAIASIRDRIRVRQTRVPDISRWLEARVR